MDKYIVDFMGENMVIKIHKKDYIHDHIIECKYSTSPGRGGISINNRIDVFEDLFSIQIIRCLCLMCLEY